jgi:hypothetical protein
MEEHGHVRKVRGCGRLTHWVLWHLRHVCTQEFFPHHLGQKCKIRDAPQEEMDAAENHDLRL